MATGRVEQACGTVIRRRRHKLGLSQEEFAEKAEIHRTYVSSIELGKVQIGIGIAFKLATALGILLSRLFREIKRDLE